MENKTNPLDIQNFLIPECWHTLTSRWYLHFWDISNLNKTSIGLFCPLTSLYWASIWKTKFDNLISTLVDYNINKWSLCRILHKHWDMWTARQKNLIQAKIIIYYGLSSFSINKICNTRRFLRSPDNIIHAWTGSKSGEWQNHYKNITAQAE